jgi:hypothetical protein
MAFRSHHPQSNGAAELRRGVALSTKQISVRVGLPAFAAAGTRHRFADEGRRDRRGSRREGGDGSDRHRAANLADDGVLIARVLIARAKCGPSVSVL